MAIRPTRPQLVIWVCIGLITGASWAYLLHLGRDMSAAMSYGQMMADMGMPMDQPWCARDLLLTALMWTVMMAGMMAPSTTPVLSLFSATTSARGAVTHPTLRVAAFATGYGIVWTSFSGLAALAQWAMHEAALLSPSMASSSPAFSGLVLAAAGVYQLTPAKEACLRQCRSPLGFLLGYWRDGATGAVRMGIRHGTFCLGCCWALMCVLFVVGVMNLVWVGILSVLVLLEKVGPRGDLVARTTGAALIAAGVLSLGRGA